MEPNDLLENILDLQDLFRRKTMYKQGLFYFEGESNSCNLMYRETPSSAIRSSSWYTGVSSKTFSLSDFVGGTQTLAPSHTKRAKYLHIDATYKLEISINERTI